MRVPTSGICIAIANRLFTSRAVPYLRTPMKNRPATPRAAAPAPSVLRLTVACAAVVASLAACEGTTDLAARFDNLEYDAEVFALNGTPIGAPTAINTVFATTVRPDPTYDFDVAFDLDAQGRPLLYAQRRIGHPANGAGRQVSLQPMEGPFQSVERAPESRWVADSLLTVAVGEVVVVRVVASICQFDFSPYVFSKLVVDSVDVASRQLWVTALTNPNCGFRSLQPGRPRN